MYDKQISELSVDEYFYLTENLEVLDRESTKKGVEYVLYSRRQRIVDIVRTAIQNELLPLERQIVLEHLGEGVSAVALQKKYGISHSAFYRALNSAKKKLVTTLKYVLIYDGERVPVTAQGLIEYVKRAEN